MPATISIALDDQYKGAIFAHTNSELYRLTMSLDAFGALDEIIWGRFYDTYIKHGNPDIEFKSPSAAIEAYRAFVIDVLSERKLDVSYALNE